MAGERIHVCAPPPPKCSCGGVLALEPDERCPIHSGWRDPQERCRWCGKFMRTDRDDSGETEEGW